MSNLVYGVGFYEKGEHRAKINGKNTYIYNAWHNMLTRCYNPKYHEIQPTYIDCDVCCDWLNFQSFAKWLFNHQYYGLGYAIDKDLLRPNNKIYAPDNCLLIPQEINNLLTNRANHRGKYPQGVAYRKDTNKIQAHISKYGKHRRIGYFDTVQEAAEAYRAEKESYVKEVAEMYKNRMDIRVYNALMNWRLTA